MLLSTMLPGERATNAIIEGSTLANYATLNFWCCWCQFSISNIPHKKSRIGANNSSAFIRFNLWNASLSEKVRLKFWHQFAIIFLYFYWICHYRLRWKSRERRHIQFSGRTRREAWSKRSERNKSWSGRFFTKFKIHKSFSHFQIVFFLHNS